MYHENERINTLIAYIENDVNEGNKISNATPYDGEFRNEVIVRFANRTADSQNKHYPMVVTKAIELGGMIKSTHPGSWETVIRF